MFKISEFSRLTRVSIKMLRHYDELGLLKPAAVDPGTGYRSYTADQLPRLNRIIALKDLGFSLSQVTTLLDGALSVDELRGMLKLRQAEVAARLQTERQRLALLDAHLRQLDNQPHHLAHDVIVRAIAPQLVASIRTTLATGEEVAPIFDQLETYALTHRARAASSPLCILHDREFRDDEADVEVAVPLSTPIPPAGAIKIYELPGVVTMACCVYTGGYDGAPLAMGALLRWAEANSAQIVGPLREVYLQFGANRAYELRLPPAFITDRDEDYVTELQLPVELRPTTQDQRSKEYEQ